MAKIKGICKNIDGCSLAEDKVEQMVEKSEFICSECGKPLSPVEDKSTGSGGIDPNKKKLIILIIAAVVVIGGIVGAVLGISSSKKQKAELEFQRIADSIEQARIADSIEQARQDSIALATKLAEADALEAQRIADSIRYAFVQDSLRQDSIAKAKKKSGNGGGVSSSTKSYPCGTYKGKLKNGYPDGDGTMTYKRHTRIAKQDSREHYAEAGDRFVGIWGNGDIVSGALYGSDGVIKEKILTSKRFNVYDLSKD